MVSGEDIVVVDRHLVHGDPVEYQDDASQGKCGIVVSTKRLLNLRDDFGNVAEGVDASQVRPLEPFEAGSLVMCDGWLGTVEETINDLVIKWDDGSCCRVRCPTHHTLRPAYEDELETAYFRGMHVQIVHHDRLLRDALWYIGESSHDLEYGTVINLLSGQVGVAWSSKCHPQVSDQAPDAIVAGTRLSTLTHYKNAWWNLLDQAVIRRGLTWWEMAHINKDVSTRDLVDVEFSQVVDIVGIRTSASVCWQDGHLTENMESRILLPLVPGPHTFFPNEYVCKRDFDGPGGLEGATCGYVERVDALSSMCSVRWMQDTNDVDVVASAPIQVSSFDLMLHPAFVFSLGEVVVRRDSRQAERHDLATPWVGEVVGFKDGSVTVAWIDGSMCRMPPGQVLPLLKDEPSARLQQPDLLLAATSQLTQVAQHLLLGSRLAANRPATVSAFVDDYGTIFYSDGTKEASPSLDDRTRLFVGDDENCNGYLANHANMATTSTGNPNDRLFEFVREFHTHHFKQSTELFTKDPKFTRHVLKEWKTLQNELPDGIHVQVCESQMFLLRAVVTGPRATPYENGLFCFDVAIPSTYPSTPPLVHFYANGVRLNPNLHENGKVCLSLLGMWPGQCGSDGWRPQDSSLLQVLVSIQGLVLTPDPYYNQPGREGERNTPHGRLRSAQYNESARLLTLHSMVSMVQNPPLSLTSLVRRHFGRAFRDIVASTEAVLRVDEQLDDHPYLKRAPSSGFKAALRSALDRMNRVFVANGIDANALGTAQDDNRLL